MSLVEQLQKESREFAEFAGRLLLTKNWKLGTAESCTSGAIASMITDIAGSSAYFNGGIVSYANEIKTKVLGVREDTLSQYGAVSEQTVCEMAEAALKILNIDVSIAISGILGPSGGSTEKPVGTVWMAISCRENTRTRLFHFNANDRILNKSEAVRNALNWLCDFLRS